MVVGKKSCVFCRIADHKAESHIVFRDELSLALLDRKPLFLGHCLLMPIQHYETLADLPREMVGPLFTNAQLMAAAVQKGMSADGSFVAINNKVSQSVPHLHIHIVPRREKDGLKGFFWPRRNYTSKQDVLQVRKAIQIAIEELQAAHMN